MSLKIPSAEDLGKIHSEITQIVNQRFLITTSAITVFGVFVAWLIPKDAPTTESSVAIFTIAGSMLLTWLLGALYLFNHFFLRGMLRVYTSYLIVTQSSSWEYDWQRYRLDFRWYLGYTKGQAVVFLFLGAVSTCFPFAIALGYSLNLCHWNWLWADIVTGAIYLLFVLLTGVLNWLNPEQKAKEKWQKLKDEEEAIT